MFKKSKPSTWSVVFVLLVAVSCNTPQKIEVVARVSDQTGQALPSVRILISEEEVGLSGVEGKAFITGISVTPEQTTVQLTFQKEGYETLFHTIPLEAKKRSYLVDVQMAVRFLEVPVRVFAKTASPSEVLEPLAFSTVYVNGQKSGQCDETGSYVVKLKPDTLTVTIKVQLEDGSNSEPFGSRECEKQMTIDGEESQLPPLNFAFARLPAEHTVNVQVKTSDGQPLEGVEVHAGGLSTQTNSRGNAALRLNRFSEKEELHIAKLGWKPAGKVVLLKRQDRTWFFRGTMTPYRTVTFMARPQGTPKEALAGVEAYELDSGNHPIKKLGRTDEKGALKVTLTQLSSSILFDKQGYEKKAVSLKTDEIKRDTVEVVMQPESKVKVKIIAKSAETASAGEGEAPAEPLPSPAEPLPSPAEPLPSPAEPSPSREEVPARVWIDRKDASDEMEYETGYHQVTIAPQTGGYKGWEGTVRFDLPKSGAVQTVEIALWSDHYDRGQRLESENQLEAAMAAYQKVISPKHPDYSAAHSRLGTLYADAGNYQKASEEFQKVVNLPQNSGYALGYYNLAHARYYAREYSAAIDGFENVENYHENLPADRYDEVLYYAYYHLGFAHEKLYDAFWKTDVAKATHHLQEAGRYWRKFYEHLPQNFAKQPEYELSLKRAEEHSKQVWAKLGSL